MVILPQYQPPPTQSSASLQLGKEAEEGRRGRQEGLAQGWTDILSAYHTPTARLSPA